MKKKITFELSRKDIEWLFKKVIGNIEPNGKWPLHQNGRITHRNALKREQLKRMKWWLGER